MGVWHVSMCEEITEGKLSQRGVLHGVLSVVQSRVSLISCRSKFHSLNAVVVVSLSSGMWLSWEVTAGDGEMTTWVAMTSSMRGFELVPVASDESVQIAEHWDAMFTMASAAGQTDCYILYQMVLFQGVWLHEGARQTSDIPRH